MRVRGRKRLVAGIALSILTFAAYSIFIAPHARQWDAMAGTFMGAMAMASPEAQEVMQFLAIMRMIAWGLGLGGIALAFWGWRAKRNQAHHQLAGIPRTQAGG